MTVDVTVTTASIPGRESLLAEAIRSVNAQTVPPYAHLIRVQQPPDGLSPAHLASQRTALLAGVNTTWTAVLDDDDVYLPHHFETIRSALAWGIVDADVVYTFAHEGSVAREDVTDWPQAQLLERLRYGNCISSNAALRTATVRRVGGWGGDYDTRTETFTGTGATWEDWDMWIRLAEIGARFVCVPVETWDYRSGPWPHCTG